MKRISFLMMCVFAFLSIAKAQNEITMMVNTASSMEVSLTEKPVILSYAPTSVTPVGNAGFGGMAFYWGYMFPVSMIEEYVGKYITQVAYLEGSGYSFILWSFVDDYDLIGDLEHQVAVYPNPTQNVVNVMAPNMNHITVLNTLGQVLYDASAEGNSVVLDLSQYDAGMYMVRVSTAQGDVVKRVNVLK